MELIGSLLLALWSRPRFAIPAWLGAGIGLSLFFLTGEEPSSAAMAVGCMLLGLLTGFTMEYFRDSPRDPHD